MEIPDLFENPPGHSPAEEPLARAQEQFDKGEYQDALGTLIRGFKEDVNYQPLYRLAAACLEKLGGDEEKELFDKAVENFDSFDSFQGLGTHFLDAGHYSLATPFLQKAHAFRPADIYTAHDLAVAYARRFQIAEAVEILEKVNAREDFSALYFLAKCKLLNRDITHVPDYIGSLEATIRNEADEKIIKIPKMMVEELKETLQRYQTIGNPATHIRDWQFIQYGSVILDCFDSEDYVAGGRYVASWGSNESIKIVIDRLRALLDSLKVPVKAVRSLADRDAEITGRAIAKTLGVGFSFYDATGPDENCLIVAADASGFNQCPELSEIKDGQVLFALNQNWLEPAYVNPDIIGLMTQSYFFPWDGGGYKIDPESGNMESTAPDNRPAEEIANDISALVPEEQDITELLSFYRQRTDWIKGIGRLANKNRNNFMIESPVPGSYFGN
jgi:hypothetical protein